ncbi:hypothetical protein HBI57_068300 [Parastagonospora nodorum]|nr:hypothetical protein HBI57_068300 [Parastagonospora nodorum]KAH6504048.1 hypothetical protein HBI58_024090 [Parastagonospora nodorum]
MHTGLTKELGARHSLLNLSVYDLSVYAVFKCLASSSNLFTTTRCRVSSLIYTKQAYLYADKYSKKYLKVREADALKQVAYITLIRLELEAQLRKASEEEELAKTKKEKREKEERLKALLNAKIRDSLSIRNKRIIKLLARAYILYFKELLSNNGRIFASVIGMTRTQAIKNEVVAIDPINSILCDLSNLLVVRFCIFSDSALENIGILTNKEIVEMQTDTATALADELAAVNKLTIAEANMPAVHSKATKHCLALLAAQFALVCSFGKVDRHVFRANNTISVIAYFIRIFESITKNTNRKYRLCLERSSAVDKVIGKHTYKTYNRVYALTAKTLSP